MDLEQEKLAVEQKLARCRRLKKDFSEGVSAKNLRDLEAELLEQLQQIETSPAQQDRD
ncbi:MULTISPECIES: hypothetical protein [Bradyrhizobium]|uniref:hypothetical protein n=1 Tax=Bradyrhizobium TaxID=374 RepID=UPI0012F4CDFE|nr:MULTISPECIES: hypothetical protein [unclassified Bradyrhizobium]